MIIPVQGIADGDEEGLHDVPWKGTQECISRGVLRHICVAHFSCQLEEDADGVVIHRRKDCIGRVELRAHAMIMAWMRVIFFTSI